MKNFVAIIALGLASLAAAQTTSAGSSLTDKPSLTPAEQSIVSAKKEIAKKPASCFGYNQLAIALSRRARETSDVTFYAQAEDTLKKSQQLAPDNIEAEKIRVWLLLGRHEFAAALEAATALNKKMPDDVLVYGFLVDANAELGKYKAAEDAAQWMLNLRPGNLPGLTRAAYLRELFGDPDGAYELMDMAYQATVPTETEDRAWMLSQMGHIRLTEGKIDDADNILRQALIIFPGYHYALANLAKVRIVQKRYEEAVTLLQQRYKASPHAENLYDLAEAMELAGHKADAETSFTEFEKQSLAEASRKDNSSRELVFYYADHTRNPQKALAIAESEFSWRHDVYTLDAYAWALHVNGRDVEARSRLDEALAVGVRDARLFAHAGSIAFTLGDQAKARLFLRESVTLNSSGSEQAHTLLETLDRAPLGE